MRDNVVDYGSPSEGEGDNRKDTTSFASCTDSNCRDEGCELLLVDSVDDGGDLVICTRDGLFQNAHKAKVSQVTDPCTSARTEC